MMPSDSSSDDDGAHSVAAATVGDRPTVVIVGDQISAGMADRLAADFEIRVLSGDDAAVGTARSRGVEAISGDITDGGFLREHSTGASAVVVATKRDRTNLLITQLFRATVPVDRLLVRLNDPACP